MPILPPFLTQFAHPVVSQTRAVLAHPALHARKDRALEPQFSASFSTTTMAGHSKWSKVKHLKTVVDGRHGKLLGKLASESAVADLRLIFSTNHGNLASTGSVAYLFRRKGQITIPCASIDDDRLLELALEAGAEDVTADEEHHLLSTAPDQLYPVEERLESAGVSVGSQKLTYIPETIAQLTDEHTAQQEFRLCDALDDTEDVRHVYADCDVPEDLLARISG